MHLVDLRTSEAQMYLNSAKGLSSFWPLTRYSELTVIGPIKMSIQKDVIRFKLN